MKVSELTEGFSLDFGTTSLTEEQIIEFGEKFDPLPFHIDKKAAEKSHFKGLVASGPHMFTKVHRDKWIPIFGQSVLAGLEINNWKFLKPIYADMPVSAKVEVLSISKNPEKGHAVIHWRYTFTDNNGEPVQIADATVLHKLD